jgi:citrate synthase
MSRAVDKPAMNKGWTTSITRIEPNRVEVVGHPIREIVERRSLPETIHLLIKKTFPDEVRLQELHTICSRAASLPPSSVPRLEHQDISKALAYHLLADKALEEVPVEGLDGECETTVFCLGRMIRTIDWILGSKRASLSPDPNEPFSHWFYRICTGDSRVDEERGRMVQALAVACIDHGLTPPSTQICRLAASARVPYEVALAQAVGAISDVHGGASGRAAEFFARYLKRQQETGMDPSDVLQGLMEETINQGKRIPGLGHRVHTADPRCDVLWSVAEETGVAAKCVQASKATRSVFSRIRGISLPINVDGVIGAIVADMGLPPIVATLVFVLGRVAGLSAHYFEEVRTFPPMRWIDFREAVYRDHSKKPMLPE